MMNIKRMVIETITAVIWLQQQAGLVDCFPRAPPNPLTIVKWVELAFDAESFSFGLLLLLPVVGTIESTVIVNSRSAIGCFVLPGSGCLCCLSKRAKLAAVKFFPENVL